jgi:hypothetical protein
MDLQRKYEVMQPEVGIPKAEFTGLKELFFLPRIGF